MEIAILIITSIALVIQVLVNRRRIYEILYPRKHKMNRAFMEFKQVKEIWLSNNNLYSPYKPNQALGLEVSKEIALKFSDAFSHWASKYAVESDSTFSHTGGICEELRERLRNIVNPIKQQGGIDSNSLNNAISEIPGILDKIEESLKKSIE